MSQGQLAGFRFTHRASVVFRDVDALGHVNNAVYLTYLETARLAYWAAVTGNRSLEELNVILARVEVDFRSPAFHGELLDVGVKTTALKRSSFGMAFRIVAADSGRLVADAHKVLVCYDYATRRPVPIAEPVRAALRAQDPDLVEQA